jgi:hypothetical protein
METREKKLLDQMTIKQEGKHGFFFGSLEGHIGKSKSPVCIASTGTPSACFTSFTIIVLTSKGLTNLQAQAIE